MNNLEEIVNHYLDLSGRSDFSRHCRAAKQLLELCDGNVELAQKKLDNTFQWFDQFGEKEDFRIETVIKKFLEV